ncbi:hypothetical protein V6K52_09070 [Knoellia sp. S7-12]|uniref:hypothetical protein n=1 Tax=Knoellia sp. S7-12 TaxID=3126698 RepID=UPI0033672534
MTGLASAILSLALWLLPQQERRRYADEFDPDLRSLPGGGRLAYAVSTVLGMPRLRWDSSPVWRGSRCRSASWDPRQYTLRVNPKGLGPVTPPQL